MADRTSEQERRERLQLEQEQRERRRRGLQRQDHLHFAREQRERLQLELAQRERRRRVQRHRQENPGALRADLERLQEMEKEFARWSAQIQSYAEQTHDPFSRQAFANVLDGLEGQRAALQQLLASYAQAGRLSEELPLEGPSETMPPR